MDCPCCFVREPEQDVVFRADLVWFLQDRRHQDALKHSGIIIPIAHRETVFDLTESEIAATFKLLWRVKAWMDVEFARWWPGSVPCAHAPCSAVPARTADRQRAFAPC